MMKEDYDVQDDYINDFGTMDDYDDDDEDDFACYSTGAGGGVLCVVSAGRAERERLSFTRPLCRAPAGGAVTTVKRKRMWPLNNF